LIKVGVALDGVEFECSGNIDFLYFLAKWLDVFGLLFRTD